MIAVAVAGIVAAPRSSASPTDPGGTFDDDDGLRAEGFIEALVAADVVRGCSAEQYCPDGILSRGQMAAFLARALGLPPAGADHFDDDDGTEHEDAINRVAEAGIAFGVRPSIFDPSGTLSRGQVASLLARAFGFPAVSSNSFDDDDGSVHEANIDAGAVAAVLEPCGGGGRTFCPTAPLLRADMAVFVAKALHLEPTYPPPRTSSTTTTTSLPVAPPGARSTRDRPDEGTEPEFQAIYAVPSDGVDHGYDTDGSIATTVQLMSDWMSSQSGGARPRFDTYRGSLDIGFVQLSETDAQISAGGEGVAIGRVLAAIAAAGWTDTDTIYAVWYDGGASIPRCGQAQYPATRGGGSVEYLLGADPGFPACNTNPWGAGRSQPTYWDYSMLHELVHNLGGAPSCGANYFGGGHTDDDTRDLMWGATDGGWQPSLLDPGHDDYFDHSIPGCLDIADSAFLDPTPPNAGLPPGW